MNAPPPIGCPSSTQQGEGGRRKKKAYKIADSNNTKHLTPMLVQGSTTHIYVHTHTHTRHCERATHRDYPPLTSFHVKRLTSKNPFGGRVLSAHLLLKLAARVALRRVVLCCVLLLCCVVSHHRPSTPSQEEKKRPTKKKKKRQRDAAKKRRAVLQGVSHPRAGSAGAAQGCLRHRQAEVAGGGHVSESERAPLL